MIHDNIDTKQRNTPAKFENEGATTGLASITALQNHGTFNAVPDTTNNSACG